MRVEHVALWVRDLEAQAAFYARHFQAEAGPRYHNPATGFESRFLSFDSGARLELMRMASVAPTPEQGRGLAQGWAHLAISVGDRAEVDALTARMADEGVPVLDGPRTTGDGYYESVVLDPEGNRLEITE